MIFPSDLLLGLSGFFGLTISAVIVLSPGFTGTSGTVTLPPLSRSSLVISFSPIFLPFPSLMTNLSPGFTLPSVGTTATTGVLLGSLSGLSPVLFSASEIIPSLFASSGKLGLDGVPGLRVRSGSTLPAPDAPPPTLSTGPAKDPAPKGFIALVSALIFE